MIKSSEAYKNAIVGKSRRTRIKAIVDITDPDMITENLTTPTGAPWSIKEELLNRKIRGPKYYSTLERGRWPLDATARFFPDNYRSNKEMGFTSQCICDEYGYFSEPIVFRQEFSNCSILQAAEIYGSENKADGLPEDITLKVYAGDTAYATMHVTGNRERKILIMGFTVYYPTAIEVIIERWSLPWRRARIIEIVAGIYEEWYNQDFSGFTATQQADFSCMKIPYGTAKLTLNNVSRRFDPRNKLGVFESIEEKQGIDLYIGVDIPLKPGDDEDEEPIEYKRIGMYYQNKNGWKTSDNDLVITWSLVDIIGLLADRKFIIKDGSTLPTTLSGWVAEIVAQIGVNFKKRYLVDPNYANMEATVTDASELSSASCGDVLRWVCMVTGTWPRADAETGKLAVEPLWNQGNKITLRQLVTYPHMEANESISALIYQFKENDEPVEYVVLGNSTSSEKTITIQNPFIHSKPQALTASRTILSYYGGNIYQTTGRGDPSSEIGDVDTIWLDKSNAATARRMMQTFNFQQGVMQRCVSRLLQADGSYLWTEYAIIRKSGKWKVPNGVHQIRIIIGSGGQGGGHGVKGTLHLERFPLRVVAEYGENGADGHGGKIWFGIVGVNPGQEMDVHLGAGGAAATVEGEVGELGEDTTFGLYSSADGIYYESGYTDIANGQVFARTGVEEPLPGSGDGGKGGAGGEPGVGYLYQNSGDIGYRFKRVKEPGPGHPGVRGATGFVMVTWDKV